MRRSCSQITLNRQSPFVSRGHPPPSLIRPICLSVSVCSVTVPDRFLVTGKLRPNGRRLRCVTSRRSIRKSKSLGQQGSSEGQKGGPSLPGASFTESFSSSPDSRTKERRAAAHLYGGAALQLFVSIRHAGFISAVSACTKTLFFQTDPAATWRLQTSPACIDSDCNCCVPLQITASHPSTLPIPLSPSLFCYCVPAFFRFSTPSTEIQPGLVSIEACASNAITMLPSMDIPRIRSFSSSMLNRMAYFQDAFNIGS